MALLCCRKMRYKGGFRLGRRIMNIWRRLCFRRRCRCSGFGRVDHFRPKGSLAATLCEWGRHISRRLLGTQIGERASLLMEEEGWGPLPKGHLAVYVSGGRKEDAGALPELTPRRFVVPVIYFNHPLFRELLREAEGEFGFHHPGGITIPCHAAKFERVRSQIAAVDHSPRRKSGARSFVL